MRQTYFRKKGHKAPCLTPNEIARVNDMLDWVKKHGDCMPFEVLCSVPRLIEFVYKPAAHAAVKITEDFVRVRFNHGSHAENTRGATPRKDQAQAAGKGKPSQMDKGKGKM